MFLGNIERNQWNEIWKLLTAWKVSKYGVFSGRLFPEFGLNTERYEVSVRTWENTDQKKLRIRTLFTQWLHGRSIWLIRSWLLKMYVLSLSFQWVGLATTFEIYCVKSVQIQSLRLNTGKYGQEKALYLDVFSSCDSPKRNLVLQCIPCIAAIMLALCVFPHLDSIWRFTDKYWQITLFSPNQVEYRT